MSLTISPESIGLPITQSSRAWSPESAAEWEALLASEGMPAEPVRRSTVSLDLLGGGAVGTADLLSSLSVTDRTAHRGRWVVDADGRRVWEQPTEQLVCSVSTEELPVGWLMSATDGAPSHGDGAASTTSGVSSASKRTRRTASTHGVGGTVDLARWLRGRDLPVARSERARAASPDAGHVIVRTFPDGTVVAGRYVLVNGSPRWESLDERAERLRLLRTARTAGTRRRVTEHRERTRVGSVARDLPRVGSMTPRQVDGLRRRWVALSPTGRRLVCEALDLPTDCIGVDSLPEGAQARGPVSLT